MAAVAVEVPGQPFIDTSIQFISPKSPLENVRYVSPGKDYNTASFDAHNVRVFDGRANQSEYQLETCGFTLAKHESKLRDLRDRDLLEAEYIPEMEAFVKELTGADLVVGFGIALRATTATPGGKFQEPGTDAHCDYNTETSKSLAGRMLAARGLTDFEYKNFKCINVWRAISEPPQDWPLAVCQAQTVGDHEKYFNKMVTLDTTLEVNNLPPVPEGRLPTAILFEYRDGYRWNYFSNMKADEVLAFKLFDSRKDLPRRCPHAAIQDVQTKGVWPRESVEIRTVAYFKN